MSPHSPLALQDSKATIFDTLVMLIFGMIQPACHVHFQLLRQPIQLLCQTVTMGPFDG
jgi:hypothetical protein